MVLLLNYQMTSLQKNLQSKQKYRRISEKKHREQTDTFKKNMISIKSNANFLVFFPINTREHTGLPAQLLFGTRPGCTARIDPCSQKLPDKIWSTAKKQQNNLQEVVIMPAIVHRWSMIRK